MPASRKATTGCFLKAHSRTRKLRELVQSLKIPTVSACALGRQLSLALRPGRTPLRLQRYVPNSTVITITCFHS